MPLITSRPYFIPPDPQGLNPDDVRTGNTLSEDRLTLTAVSSPGINAVRGNVIPQGSGKYYFEVQWDNYSDGQEGNMAGGVSTISPWNGEANGIQAHSSGAAYYDYFGGTTDEIRLRQKFSINQFGSLTTVDTGVTNISQMNNRVLGIKADLDAFTYEFVDIDGGTIGPYTFPSGGGSPAIFVPFITISGAATSACTVNFGASSYTHGLPSGYSNWTFE